MPINHLGSFGGLFRLSESLRTKSAPSCAKGRLSMGFEEPLNRLLQYYNCDHGIITMLTNNIILYNTVIYYHIVLYSKVNPMLPSKSSGFFLIDRCGKSHGKSGLRFPRRMICKWWEKAHRFVCLLDGRHGGYRIVSCLDNSRHGGFNYGQSMLNRLHIFETTSQYILFVKIPITSMKRSEPLSTLRSLTALRNAEILYIYVHTKYIKVLCVCIYI